MLCDGGGVMPTVQMGKWRPGRPRRLQAAALPHPSPARWAWRTRSVSFAPRLALQGEVETGWGRRSLQASPPWALGMGLAFCTLGWERSCWNLSWSSGAPNISPQPPSPWARLGVRRARGRQLSGAQPPGPGRGGLPQQHLRRLRAARAPHAAPPGGREAVPPRLLQVGARVHAVCACTRVHALGSMCMCMHSCVCALVSVCTCVYVCIHSCVCALVSACACICVCVCSCMCMCVCECLCAHVHPCVC